MSFLKQVTKGKVKRPLFAIIYGPDGVGKSSFVAGAPKPIFLGKESGTFNLDVSRFPEVKTFEDVMSAIAELKNEKHDFLTLGLDSLDHLEPIVWDKVCRDAGAKNIEKVDGGYGKGYLAALAKWREMIDALCDLRDTKGMGIIPLAHSQIKTFNDPSQPSPYDRYQMKLNEKAAALWRESVDLVGFATYEVVTHKEKDDKRAKAFGDGKRILYTERRPSFDAKNRMNVPYELPLSYADLIAAIDSAHAPSKAENLKKDIAELVELVTDTDTKTTVNATIAKAGNNVDNLTMILNRLRVLTTKE